MAKIQKINGEYPIETAFRGQKITFDANGFAEVSEDIAEAFTQIPDYVIVEEAKPAKQIESSTEDSSTEEPKPLKRSPKK